MAVLLACFSHGVRAEEAGSGIRVGDTEESVLAALGEPKGSMAVKGRKTLMYSGFWVVIEEGKVEEVKRLSAARADSAPKTSTATSSPDSASVAEVRDIYELMKEIQSSHGIEKAHALERCTGAWAAPAVPLLVSLLEDQTQFRVLTTVNGTVAEGGISMGRIAANSLGTIGMPAWDPCMQVLRTGTPFARANAVDTLQSLYFSFNPEDTSFRDLLIEVFLSSMMDGSTEALHDKGNMAAIIDRFGTPEALAALHRSLSHPAPFFVGTVADILARRRAPESIPFLAKTFLKSADPYIRNKAGEALLGYSDPAAARAVLGGANSSDVDIRRTVAKMLGQSKNKEFAQEAIALLSDRDDEVRRNAVRSLGRMGSEVATVPLIGIALNDSYEYAAQDAFHLLSGPTMKNRDPEVVNALLPGLRQTDAKRRAWSAELLGRTGAPDAFGPLSKAAQSDPDAGVRQKVLAFLYGFENPERSAVILKCYLGEQDSQARQAALQTVKYGSLRDRQEEILLGVVRGGDEARAREAAFVMDELHLVKRNPDVLSVFVSLLGDSDSKSRERAEEALCREANVPRYSAKGKEFGGNPAKWKAWWQEQGIALR